MFFLFLETDGKCQNVALGMESRTINDEQITASSEWNHNHAAIQGRLNFKATWKSGAWSALTNDPNQWLQVDLIGQYIVTRVATQGRNRYHQWVKKYKLQYSDDGARFRCYKEPRKNDHKVKLISGLERTYFEVRPGAQRVHLW